MIQSLTVGVNLSSVGAAESIIQHLNANTTSSSKSFVFPLTRAGELIKDKTSRAAPLHGNSTDALIVVVAD